MFRTHHGLKAMAALMAVLVLAGVGIGLGVTRASGPSYVPRTRDMTITAVPLLVHEQATMLPYLRKDFAAGGVLGGKEVYGFYPSTLTVYQGDTLNLTLVNPADDAHTFTIAGPYNVNAIMPGESTVTTHFTASHVGVYTFLCAEPEHVPFMWGQLVVLPDSAALPSSRQ